MRPEEIRPDTKLCTILGYNAQTSNRRRYFNRILKLNGINATSNCSKILKMSILTLQWKIYQTLRDRVILKMRFPEKFKGL